MTAEQGVDANAQLERGGALEPARLRQVPEQAIEEAKLTREMLEREAEKTAAGVEQSVVEGSGK